MTDKEKAVVMAYTGIAMLTGDKFDIFHKYVENIMGRPVFTHEFATCAEEIKEKSKPDFLKLCAEEEKEAKKCPKCGSDLYEYCFMCCYEGEKVTKNGGEDIPKSPSQECMKRGEQVCEWIKQGMKEADEWIKENGKNPYADILLEKEGEKNEVD